MNDFNEISLLSKMPSCSKKTITQYTNNRTCYIPSSLWISIEWIKLT